MIESRPKALLVASMWWPLSARLALSLMDSGWTVEALCPPGHPVRCLDNVAHLSTYRRLGSLRSLEDAIEHAQPDLIVPCDDGVVWQLHALHSNVPALRTLIERSLGDPASYPVVRSRGTLLQTASGLGIRVPETHPVRSAEDLDSIHLPAVLKVDGTWGGNGVQMVRSPSELLSVFDRFHRPPTFAVAWKRLLVDHNPLALWMLRQDEGLRITAQQLISGRPANTMMVCDRGQMLGMLTVEVLCSQGPTGAATVVRVVDLPEITRAACLLTHRLGLSGFHGLDFVLEHGTNQAFLLELNPRCTQLGHLALGEQPSLASCLEGLLGQALPARSTASLDGQMIAFFPQAVTLNPHSPYLRHAFHDVPWHHPALVRHLMLGHWPSRQWPSRLYHRFHSPVRQPEVCFAL